MLELKAYKVLQVFKEHKVFKALRDGRVPKVLPVYKVHKV